MKSWILSIIIVVLSISIISLLFPSGKLGKFIKSIFAFVLTLVILKPITELKNQEFFVDFDKLQISYQEEYLDYVNSFKVNKIIENCKLIANNYGVENLKVNVEYELAENAEFCLSKVVLNFENTVINSDKEHIVIIEKVKTAILNYLNVDYSKVVVYG